MPTMNLKRALKLKKELEARLAKIELPTAISVSLLVEANQKDPLPAINAGTSSMMAKVSEFMSLSQILATVRTAIAQENAASGVDDLLAEAGHLDRLIALAKKLVDMPVLPVDEIVLAEVKMSVDDLNSSESRTYGRGEKNKSFAVSTTDIREASRQNIGLWKRQKEAVEDRRTALNASHNIRISDADAQLLTKLGII